MQVAEAFKAHAHYLAEWVTREQGKPLGVIGAIAPWNWPLLIAIWQIIPSIRAGNAVVIKPSEYTSIGTLELGGNDAAIVLDDADP